MDMSREEIEAKLNELHDELQQRFDEIHTLGTSMVNRQKLQSEMESLEEEYEYYRNLLQK
jgi:hypothetical protein